MGSGRLKESKRNKALGLSGSQKTDTEHQKDVVQAIETLKQNADLFRKTSYSTGSSASSQDSEAGGEEGADVIKSPDGGWAWVVCFSSCMIMLILDGILFSFGVLFLELVDSFGESKSKTSMVGSVCMGVHLIVAPFTSALVNLFSSRVVAMSGGVMTATAFAISMFAPSIDVLIVTYGVLGGIGISFIYLPSILIVGFYFDRRRAVANGISNAGSGLGAFIFAPLTRYFIDQYTWRGWLLLLSGIVLHCVVLAALYRPIWPSQSLRKKTPSNLTLSTNEGSDVSHQDCGSDKADVPLVHETVVAMKNPRISALRLDHVKTSRSYGDLSSEAPGSSVPMLNVASRAFHQNTHLSMNMLNAIPSTRDDMAPRFLRKRQPTAEATHDFLDKPLCRTDIFYSGSVYHLDKPDEQNHSTHKTSVRNLAAVEAADSSSPAQTEILVDPDRASFLGILKTMLNLKLITTPHLGLYICSGVLWTTHNSVLNTLPDYAVLSGHNSQRAAMLLSIIGISNIVGRLVSGGLATHPNLRAIWINMAALCVGGATVFFIPYTTDYVLLCTQVTVFGFCMGTWTSLRPIVLVELLGIQNLTSSLGLCGMFQGIAFSVGSPLSGLIYDKTQSYNLAFSLASAAFVLSGLICIPMCYLIHLQAKRTNTMQPMDIVVTAPPEDRDTHDTHSDCEA